MSTSHPIKQLLGVKDKYIQIHNCHEDVYKGKIAEADLIRSFNRCQLCKDANQHIVKNGKKILMVLLNQCVNHLTYLRLKKQRYHCRAYRAYFTAYTHLVNRHCFISKT